MFNFSCLPSFKRKFWNLTAGVEFRTAHLEAAEEKAVLAQELQAMAMVHQDGIAPGDVGHVCDEATTVQQKAWEWQLLACLSRKELKNKRGPKKRIWAQSFSGNVTSFWLKKLMELSFFPCLPPPPTERTTMATCGPAAQQSTAGLETMV